MSQTPERRFIKEITDITERLEFPIGLGYDGSVAKDLREALNRLRDPHAHATPPTPLDCVVQAISSRVCEHGTKGCIVRHKAETPEAEPTTWRDVAHDFHNGLVGQGMAGAINYDLIERATKGFDALVEREAAVLPRERPEPICQAKRTADPPQDCNWPLCGCDPHADRVIAALQECDMLHPAGERERLRAQIEALKDARHGEPAMDEVCETCGATWGSHISIYCDPPMMKDRRTFSRDLVLRSKVLALLAVPAAATGGEQ